MDSFVCIPRIAMVGGSNSIGVGQWSMNHERHTHKSIISLGKLGCGPMTLTTIILMVRCDCTMTRVKSPEERKIVVAAHGRQGYSGVLASIVHDQYRQLSKR